MINFLKKHKVLTGITIFFLMFDILVAILALTPSGYDIIAPGGLNTVQSVIDVESDIKLKGSFYTTYVYSIERVSLLQELVAKISKYNEVSPSSQTVVLNNEDSRLSGKIQKNQSIEASLICAYNAAKEDNPLVNLDFSFKGFIVYTHQINHNVFKVGDIITNINEIDTSDINKLADALNNLKSGDKITYLRNDEIKPYVVEEDFKTNKKMFYCYSKYEIKSDNANPSFKLSNSTTSGPSGGLMQTLSIYSQITGKDYTFGRVIAGTGTISVSGKVGIIGGISQKIVTAIYNGADMFLCPAENYDEALETYNKTIGNKKMILVKVETFNEAITKLKEIYENK